MMIKLKNYLNKFYSINNKIPFIDKKEIIENKEKILYLYDFQKNKNKIVEQRIINENKIYNIENDLTENMTILNNKINYFNNNNVIYRDVRKINYIDVANKKIQNLNESDYISNDIKLDKKNKLNYDYNYINKDYDLKSNELLITNLSNNFNISEFKIFLKNKNINLKNIVHIKLGKDKWLRPAYLKIILKDTNHLSNFVNINNEVFNNKYIQIITPSDKKETIKNRCLVVCGFKNKNQPEEIVSELMENNKILDFSIATNYYSTNLPTFKELKKTIEEKNFDIKDYMIEVIGKDSKKYLKLNEKNEYIEENFVLNNDLDFENLNYENEIYKIVENLKKKNKKIISCYENNLPDKYKNKRSNNYLFSLIGNNTFNIFEKEKNLENHEFLFITAPSLFETQKLIINLENLVLKNSNSQLYSCLKLNTNFYFWNKNNIFKILKKKLTATKNYDNMLFKNNLEKNLEDIVNSGVDKTEEEAEAEAETEEDELSKFSEKLNENYLKLKKELNPLSNIKNNKLKNFNQNNLEILENNENYGREKLKLLIKDYLKESVHNNFFNEENLMETNLPNIENYIKVNEKGRVFNEKITNEDFNLFKKRVEDRDKDKNFSPEIRKILSEMTKYDKDEINNGFRQVLIEYGLEESNKNFIEFINNSNYDINNFKNIDYLKKENQIQNNLVNNNVNPKFNYNFFNKRYFSNYYEYNFLNIPIFLNYIGVNLPLENIDIEDKKLFVSKNETKKILKSFIQQLIDGSIFEDIKIKNDNHYLSLYSNYKYYEKIKNLKDYNGNILINKNLFDKVIDEKNLGKTDEEVLYEKDKKYSKLDLFNILNNRFDKIDLNNIEKLAFKNIYEGIPENILEYKNDLSKIDGFIDSINNLDPNYSFQKIENNEEITILKKYSLGIKLRIKEFELFKKNELNFYLKNWLKKNYTNEDLENYFSNNYDEIEKNILNEINQKILNVDGIFYRKNIIPFLSKNLLKNELDLILRDDEEEIENQYDLYYKYLEITKILEGDILD